MHLIPSLLHFSLFKKQSDPSSIVLGNNINIHLSTVFGVLSQPVGTSDFKSCLLGYFVLFL